mmetsp:Transcript_25796/g.28498  ORF Transcript_25796/g.28498 Transcript_25796/m.28498 type:complete len:90 (-) Transcript_25796:9-278(-)
MRAHPAWATYLRKKPRIADTTILSESKTHVVTAEEVESEKNVMMSIVEQMPPEITAAWMARDGDAPAQAPEHPLFSPTRPKMSDASGRD